jgi:hypothetical protein
LENTSGVSLLGSGTPIRAENLQKHVVEELNVPFVQGTYVVKFDEDFKKSAMGIPNGFYNFQGRKDSLVINAGSAGTATTYTFSPTLVAAGVTGAAITGNLLEAEINGQHRVLELGSTNSTTILTAVNSIPFLKERNVEVASVTNLHNITPVSADVVFSFSPKYDFIHDEIKSFHVGVKKALPSATATDVVVGLGEPVVARGSQGFTSGSSYTTELYLFKFRELCIGKEGRMSVKDM